MAKAPGRIPPDLRRIMGGVAGAAGWCHERRWAERNAGNISVNISGIRLPAGSFRGGNAVPLSRRYPSLGGRILLITGTGTRMRDIAADPAASLGLIRVASSGNSYETCWWGKGEFSPTTELPTHLGIHEYCVATGSSARAVLHTHPDESIALTHCVSGLNERRLNAILLSMLPETVMVHPRGIGWVPYRLPGTEAIAAATVRALRRSSTLFWEKHGVLAVAPDITEAFDRIETANKAAKLYLLCLGTGKTPRGLSPGQVSEIRRAYGITGGRKKK